MQNDQLHGKGCSYNAQTSGNHISEVARWKKKSGYVILFNSRTRLNNPTINIYFLGALYQLPLRIP